VQRQERADLQHLQACVGTEDVVDDEQPVAVRDAHPDRLGDPRREQLRPRERPRAQLVQVEIAVPELKQLRPELVLVGVEVLLDEAVLLQRPEEPVDRRLRQADALREIAQPEPPGVLSERLQDPHGAVDRLNLLPSYCRTPFDIVE
jgi:hypothetical protein